MAYQSDKASSLSKADPAARGRKGPSAGVKNLLVTDAVCKKVAALTAQWRLWYVVTTGTDDAFPVRPVSDAFHDLQIMPCDSLGQAVFGVAQDVHGMST